MVQYNFAGALQRPIGSGFNATSTTSDVKLEELILKENLDEVSAKQLWKLTKELTGITFNMG